NNNLKHLYDLFEVGVSGSESGSTKGIGSSSQEFFLESKERKVGSTVILRCLRSTPDYPMLGFNVLSLGISLYLS
ncbi:hypothetical protein, partial [Klebsiella pneumoniae]|uniref:hypothetical protein n=1 Tax=Klebsiella pneumoniae TaxID=573 RepID=UPI001D0DE73A